MSITTTERVTMLAETLAATIADVEGVHPAHARNRVDLAVRIVSSMDRALSNSSGSERPLTAEDLIEFATRKDGQRVSPSTRRLISIMWVALGGEEVPA